jgi:FAD/FMN-containing dehydrogenase
MAALSERLRRDALGVEAFAVRGGRLAVLVYLLDDADSLLYPLRMAKAMVPLRLSRRYGGTPYATGMWFSALAETVFGRDKLARVRRLKAEHDPRELLNPGNLGGPWLPLLPCLSLSRLIVWATACIGPLAALFPSPRRRSS